MQGARRKMRHDTGELHTSRSSDKHAAKEDDNLHL